MTERAKRVAWCTTAFALIFGLVVLDGFRFGPATSLSRCNLALSRSAEDAADVLVVGSSRTGTAIDPVALEGMLGAESGFEEPTVERIALGRSPLRANVALLENYLGGRGDPEVILFEISFLTERSVDRIEALESGLTAESFLFKRDVNLMRYGQILAMPAVAMPYSESETRLNRLRYRLRGVTLRSGALAYHRG